MHVLPLIRLLLLRTHAVPAHNKHDFFMYVCHAHVTGTPSTGSCVFSLSSAYSCSACMWYMLMTNTASSARTYDMLMGQARLLQVYVVMCVPPLLRLLLPGVRHGFFMSRFFFFCVHVTHAVCSSQPFFFFFFFFFRVHATHAVCSCQNTSSSSSRATRAACSYQTSLFDAHVHVQACPCASPCSLRPRPCALLPGASALLTKL
jgi:hypothetical protein